MGVRDPRGCWGAAAIACNSPIRSLAHSFTLPGATNSRWQVPPKKTFPSAFPAQHCLCPSHTASPLQAGWAILAAGVSAVPGQRG